MRTNKFKMVAKSSEPTRKQLLDELAQLQARVAELEATNFYAKIFQTAPIPLALTSLDDGDYLATNELFQQLSGYSQAELTERVDSQGLPINP